MPKFSAELAISWVLSFGWVLAVSLGVLMHKGVSLSLTSPWRLLALLTSVIIGLLTNYALGLTFPEFALIPSAYMFFVSCVLVYGWWRLFHPSAEGHSKESQANPIYFLALFVVAIIVFMLSKSMHWL